jgi:hypothetical protein
MASPNNLEGGWHPPNEHVSRVGAIAVASPQIKLVSHQLYSQMNQHDFGACLVVVLLKYCIKWTVVSFFTAVA